MLFGNVHSNANLIKISSFVSAAGNVRRLKLFSFALPAVEPNILLMFSQLILSISYDISKIEESFSQSL